MILELEGQNLTEQQAEPEYTLVENIHQWYQDHKDQEVTLIGAVEKTIRNAEEDGELQVEQDKIDSIPVRKGQFIVQNPGEDEYPYGNFEEPVRNSRQRFLDAHVETSPGKFVKKPFKAIPVTEAIKFRASNGVEMTVKPGGYVAEGLYSIAADSAKNYRVVDED